MKVLVLFRSYHGNTKQVADAVAVRLRERGHQTVVQDVREKLPDLAGIDAVINGAPTRMKGVNRRSVGVLRKLKAKGIGSRTVAIFDTCATLPADPSERAKSVPWVVPGAEGIMRHAAQKLGLRVFAPTLRCEVKELNGPLADDAIGKATAFADALTEELEKARAT